MHLKVLNPSDCVVVTGQVEVWLGGGLTLEQV